MNDAYIRARVFVIAACLAVAVTGFFIVRGFAHHITTPCDGVLETVDRGLHAPAATENLEENSGLTIEWDVSKGKGYQLDNFRVHWLRPNGERTCNDLRIAAYDHSMFTLARDPNPNTYDVLARQGMPVMSFRKVERHSWRLVDHDKLVDAGDVGLLILLGAFGALALAVIRILGARSYATRNHAWTLGTVRNDGVVESETGTMMGRLAPKTRHYGTDILVNPATLDGGAYRAIALLEKKDIAWGNHERWRKATSRGLRDARVLAVIATLTTLFAVLANQFAG